MNITVRNLTLLSIAISFYLIGEVVKIPSLYVPFGLFVVGIFLGIIRKPYNYILYLITIIIEIPYIFVEYGKMLLTLDAEINASFGAMIFVANQAVNNTTVQSTQPWWASVGTLAILLIFGWVTLDVIKSMRKNLRLYLIVSSYPIMALTFNFLFTYVYLMLTLPNLATQLSSVTTISTPETLMQFITPMYRNIIIFQHIGMSVVCMVFAPIYAYLVAKELKIYKRLGIETSKPQKPKILSSNETVIEMLRSTIIKDREEAY